MFCEEAENRDGLAKGSTIRPQVIVENLVVSAMKGLDLSREPTPGCVRRWPSLNFLLLLILLSVVVHRSIGLRTGPSLVNRPHEHIGQGDGQNAKHNTQHRYADASAASIRSTSHAAPRRHFDSLLGE